MRASSAMLVALARVAGSYRGDRDEDHMGERPDPASADVTDASCASVG